jgi:hypothetical protein
MQGADRAASRRMLEIVRLTLVGAVLALAAITFAAYVELSHAGVPDRGGVTTGGTAGPVASNR